MIPPMVPKISEEKEKISTPHNVGIYPPAVDPTKAPIQIAVLEFIFTAPSHHRQHMYSFLLPTCGHLAQVEVEKE